MPTSSSASSYGYGTGASKLLSKRSPAYSPSLTPYSSSTRGSSVKEREWKEHVPSRNSRHSDEPLHETFKYGLDLNNNPSRQGRTSQSEKSSYGGYQPTAGTAQTTSNSYGSHYVQPKTYGAVSSNYPSSGTKLTNPIGSSLYGTTRKSSIATQNRNDSCSSYDSDNGKVNTVYFHLTIYYIMFEAIIAAFWNVVSYRMILKNDLKTTGLRSLFKTM